MQRALLLVSFVTACAQPVPTAAPAEPASGGEAEVAEAPPPPASNEPVCTSNGFMMYEASETAYASRTGLGVERFAELSTSHEKPLEECGLEPILIRLASMLCNDGSNPFQGNLGAAHRSRRGNVGPGGRCGAVVDLYAVPCRERTYDVFADLYFCPAGQSPR
ncbi:MAG: hypothetical protein AAF411_04115 [Myxococcota bacterium]